MMNKNGRLSRIGDRNDRAYTSHENRWHSVNDSHSRDQNDRYSPNTDHDSLPRDTGYQNNYGTNPYYYIDEQTSFRSQYDRGHDNYLTNDDYDRTSSSSGNSRIAHGCDRHYYDDRRVSYQPQNERKYVDMKSYEYSRHPRHQGFDDTSDIFLSDDDYNHSQARSDNSRNAHNQEPYVYNNRRDSHSPQSYQRYDSVRNQSTRNNNYQSDYNQSSINYDDRRVPYSLQSNKRHDKVRRYSDSTDSNYGNDWDNQTRQSSPEAPYDEDSDNRKYSQTSPPRWSIDGQPVTFIEYQRFLVNSQKQFEGRKSRNYLFDCDKEQEFEKLMNKMKIGQRDREKLAEEMGFNDVPPPTPPRRGGFRRYRH